MSQLCVPVPNASDTTEILEQVFALCRIPWIFDFLFRADPAADISMLLAPVQKRHALSARIHINATETTSRYAHTFDFNKELIFYSVPAFSVGAITAGFCVEEPARKKGNRTGDLQCIRFVRDDDKGVFLHISENETRAVTEVDCLTHRSSTRRTRVRMRFDYHALRRVLRTPRGTLHPDDVAPSLIYLNVSDEKRACPICHDPHSGECACALPLHRPHHPLDFQFEASNMGLYTGFYQGATVVRLASAGHCVINATLQSGSVIQGESDRAVISRLHRMAVQDRLSRMRENPTRLVMPDSPLNLAALLEAGAEDDTGEEAGGEDDLALDGALDDGLFEAATVAPDGMSTPHTLVDGADTHMLPGVDVLSASDSRGQRPGLEAVSPAGSPACQEAREDVDDGGGGGGDEDGDEGGFAETDACVDACVDELVGETGATETVISGEAEREGTNEGEERDSSDAHIKSEESRSGKLRGEKECSEALDDLQKSEIRKKRNREAAARSNLKRKLRNESVRRDLARLTQRAVSLRVRETILRDENTRLRTQVSRVRAGALRDLR